LRGVTDRCPGCGGSFELELPGAIPGPFAPTGGEVDWIESTIDARCQACGEYLDVRLRADSSGASPGVIGVRLGVHPEWTIQRLGFSPGGEQLFVEAAGGSRIYRAGAERWSATSFPDDGRLLGWEATGQALLLSHGEAGRVSRLRLVRLDGEPLVDVERACDRVLGAAADLRERRALFVVAQPSGSAWSAELVSCAPAEAPRVVPLGEVWSDPFAAVDLARRHVLLGDHVRLRCVTVPDGVDPRPGGVVDYREGFRLTTALLEPEGSVLVRLRRRGLTASAFPWVQRLDLPGLEAERAPAPLPEGAAGYSTDLSELGVSGRALVLVSHVVRRFDRARLVLEETLEVEMDGGRSGRAAVAAAGDLLACTTTRDLWCVDLARRTRTSLRRGLTLPCRVL
jgi:hypothetical protein